MYKRLRRGSGSHAEKKRRLEDSVNNDPKAASDAASRASLRDAAGESKDEQDASNPSKPDPRSCPKSCDTRNDHRAETPERRDENSMNDEKATDASELPISTRTRQHEKTQAFTNHATEDRAGVSNMARRNHDGQQDDSASSSIDLDETKHSEIACEGSHSPRHTADNGEGVSIRTPSDKQADEPPGENSHTKAAGTTSQPRHLKVIGKKGDLFAAPPNSLIVHACNCLGHWGKGIAETFAKMYPRAYQVYQKHCRSGKRNHLRGTALLIPPQQGDKGPHFIGCLFTSHAIGRNKDTPEMILRSTRRAMKQLLQLVEATNCRRGDNHHIRGVYMCQINAGLFDVPWKQSRAELESVEIEDDAAVQKVTVVIR